MIVRVKMFAVARQLAGQEVIELDLPAACTVGQLRARLLEDVPALTPVAGHLVFAVDQQYASDDDAVTEEADIACIPPVSGG